MNLRNSRYDPDLRMFVDPPRKVDLPRLRFLRWLGERGLLEHGVAGAPSGELALRSSVVAERTAGRKAA
jgi:hypothetical protein